MSAPRIVIATFDAAQILDVTGPLEVFSTASRYLESAAYRTEVVTTRGGPVVASCGLEFASSPLGDVTGPIDTLLVAGGIGMHAATADEELLHHVRRLAIDARRVDLRLLRRFRPRGCRSAGGSSGNHPLGRVRTPG